MEGLKWASNLYISSGVSSRSSEAARKLDEGKIVFPSVFLITEAANSANQLEILDSRNLSHDVVRHNLGTIYGMAATKKEAVEVIERIAAACVKETGSADLREYLRRMTGSSHPLDAQDEPQASELSPAE